VLAGKFFDLNNLSDRDLVLLAAGLYNCKFHGDKLYSIG
jgi:hypothetical protein